MENIKTSQLSQDTVDYKKSNADTELKDRSSSKCGLIANFAQRTVKVIAMTGVILVGTVLFPITAIGMGADALYHSRDKGLTLFDRTRAVLASAALPLPVIGVILFRKISNNNSIKNMKLIHHINKQPLRNNDTIILSMPFVSSFFSCLHLKLNYL